MSNSKALLSRLPSFAPETGAATAPKSAKEKQKEQRQTRGTVNDRSADKATVEAAKAQKEAPPMQSEKVLSAVLEELQREGKKFEGNGTAKVARAVLSYLEERQRTAGNAKITVSMDELNRHCFDLVNYQRKGDQGQDISSPAFEACVRRGVQAALLMFDNIKQIHIPAAGPMAGQIVAPSNQVIPTLSVPVPGGKKQDVANPSSELIPVPVKLLETIFRQTHPTTGKTNRGRKPRPNGADGGKDKPLTREDMAGLPTATIMLELIGRFAKMSKIEGTEREVAADLLLKLDHLMEGDGIGGGEADEEAAA